MDRPLLPFIGTPAGARRCAKSTGAASQDGDGVAVPGRRDGIEQALPNLIPLDGRPADETRGQRRIPSAMMSAANAPVSRGPSRLHSCGVVAVAPNGVRSSRAFRPFVGPD